MATKKTTIGRTPTFAGAWVNNYVNPKTGHNGYPLKKRVSYLGSEFQSLIEDNTYEPATLNQAHTEITFDTEHWEVVSNGSDAYLLQYTVENKMDEVDARLDEQDEKVEMLNGSDVVIGVLPVSGETNKIYRVPNDPTAGKYTDYGWNGTQFVPLCTYPNDVDDEPIAGSDNLVKSGGVAEELALGAVYDVSAKNPTAGPNNDGKWESLSALLSDANLNTLVPTAVRKGGMSVKFVQSSDNKYVQYRCISNEFTTDVTKWAIAEEGVYVENPEFTYVKTDAEDRILWAIRTDGSIFYGAGVPPQVVNYINEKIAELSLDEYEDIVAFLADLEKGDETLQDLLDKKVDGEYEENPEFIEAKIDAEDKVLEGIQNDGTKVIGGDINVGGSAKILGNMEVSGVSYKVIENPEYLAAWVSVEGKIIFGLKTNGKTYVGDADFFDAIRNNAEAISFIKETINIEEIDWDSLEAFSAVESQEFIEAEFDADNKVISARKPDGKKVEYIGLETPNISIDGVEVDTIDDVVGRMSLGLDSEKKIIHYRDSDGVLHENVGIETTVVNTDSLNLTEKGMSDFQQSLKDSGFQQGGGGNWSERDNIELPEPVSYALLNLNINDLPVDGDVVSTGYAEYYDKAGNYFKIPCEITIQGQSSRIFAQTGGKGNYTLDLEKDVKFGSWVPQDSFHLKGCAKDVTRGILATSYKLAYEMQEALDAKPNRVLVDESGITTQHATGERMNDWPNDARCLPDGFPVEMYVSGEYWGIYSLQLKKHRKNYSMDKKDYTSFFIDADDLGLRLVDNKWTGGFWEGTIPWTSFDIKGPKDLVCMDGSAFDGDNPKELIDSTSPVYNADNKKHKGSAQTKAIIESFSTKYLEVKTLIDNNDLVTAKVKFDEYFDTNACMLVYIFNCLMRNRDSVNKNTLWGTYSDGKIVPMLWDLDGMYGTQWNGTNPAIPSTDTWTIYAESSWPLGLFHTLYSSEITSVYNEFRTNKVIDMDAWRRVMYGKWINRIGEEAFKRDIKRWPETPCYRKDMLNSDYWIEIPANNSLPLWDENTEYQVDDEVRIKHNNIDGFYSYKAKVSNTGKCPVTSYYNSYPIDSGWFDSPKRMEKWMIEQLRLCDVFNGFSD